MDSDPYVRYAVRVQARLFAVELPLSVDCVICQLSESGAAQVTLDSQNAFTSRSAKAGAYSNATCDGGNPTASSAFASPRTATLKLGARWWNARAWRDRPAWPTTALTQISALRKNTMYTTRGGDSLVAIRTLPPFLGPPGFLAPKVSPGGPPSRRLITRGGLSSSLFELTHCQARR